jgi:hypothetical protein
VAEAEEVLLYSLVWSKCIHSKTLLITLVHATVMFKVLDSYKDRVRYSARALGSVFITKPGKEARMHPTSYEVNSRG